MAKNFPEATLDDLLNDPLTSVIMNRDGVSRDELARLLHSVAARRSAELLTLNEGHWLIETPTYPLSAS